MFDVGDRRRRSFPHRASRYRVQFTAVNLTEQGGALQLPLDLQRHPFCQPAWLYGPVRGGLVGRVQITTSLSSESAPNQRDARRYCGCKSHVIASQTLMLTKYWIIRRLGVRAQRPWFASALEQREATLSPFGLVRIGVIRATGLPRLVMTMPSSGRSPSRERHRRRNSVTLSSFTFPSSRVRVP